MSAATEEQPNTLTIPLPPEISAKLTKEVRDEMQSLAAAILVSMSVTELTPEFTRRRDSLVAKATGCAQVITPEEEAAAASAMKALRAFEIEGENQGKSLRGPLTAATKRIKEIEDAGLAPAEKARLRLKSMLDARAEEKIAEQRRQEQEAEKERQRIAKIGRAHV